MEIVGSCMQLMCFSVGTLEDLDGWITICIKLDWSITIYLLLVGDDYLNQAIMLNFVF